VTALLLPRLVNPPDGDPGLYVSLAHEGSALLFDLGDNQLLAPREILRVGHVFVSHTHVDHFIGFDRVLRLFLARERVLTLYGPQGIARHVEAKLSGYTWNLSRDYPFAIEVREIGPVVVTRARFAASTGFRLEPLGTLPFDGIVLDQPTLCVEAAQLDHGIPCLGFAVQEKARLHVRPEALAAEGLTPGRWLTQLKRDVRAGLPDDALVPANDAPSDRAAYRLRGELRARLLLEAPGQRLAYVTDVAFTAENARRIVALVRGADIFFCEAVFLDIDRAQAARRAHLTARQAGSLARCAGVRRLEIFHASPRYATQPGALAAEAGAVLQGALAPDLPGA
jgi:ribonuclease Z